MSATIIDGKLISSQIKEELAQEVAELKAQGITPGLAVVIVGEDPASQVYVGQKEKACVALGVYSEKHTLPADISQDKLINLVRDLNNNPKINGILVQLPLPKHLDETEVLYEISPEKDVDGFHPVSVGKLVIGEAAFLPCTPHGIQELLVRSGVEVAGKDVVIVGRSNIVGKPMAMILVQKKEGANATVTICHTGTKDMTAHTKRADILIVAAGRPKTVTGDMVKDGAVVIDVGVNRTDQGLVGDVDFDSVKEKASAITPVPGGVGPMTIAMLMMNTVEAAKRQASGRSPVQNANCKVKGGFLKI